MRYFNVANNREFSREARNVRRQINRRIKRLETIVNDSKATVRNRQWAEREIRDLEQVKNESKLSMNIRGHRYTQTLEQAMAGLERMKAKAKEIGPRFTLEGDSFEITQRELNRASVNAPSVYTKKETRIFYRVTQKIWQREGIGEHDRNEAILNYYNSIRKENGLTPISLDQIVDVVLNENKKFEEMQNAEPNESMDEEQQEKYNEAQKNDNSDYDKTSPIAETAVQHVRDAMEEIFILPNPTEI